MYQNVDPTPYFKANSLLLNPGETFSLSIGLNPETRTDENADWWIAAYNSKLGWFYFDLTHGWIRAGNALNNISVSYQGKLLNLQLTEVLNTELLPLGTYEFYFGVDMLMNGVIDEPLYFHHLTLEVVQHGNSR